MSSEWGQVKLGDLVEIKHGFAFKGEFFCEAPTPYQLTTPGNFAIGGGFQSGKGKFYQGPVPEEYVLNAGDLVVTMTDLSKAADTLGYSAVVPETPGTTWLHNQRVGLVSIKPGALVSYGFVHYLMRSPEYRHWVVSTATGSTVKHTSPGRICDYEFLLPPQDYQQHVSGILGDLDTRITFLRETNATLEAIAQALFKSWFVDFNPVLAKMEGRSPEGMDEATAALFPDAFEESELGLVPNGWRTAPLDEVATFQSGYSFKTKDWSDAGHPVVKIGNVKPGFVDLAGASYVLPQVVSGLERFRLKRGDLLVGMTGYVGESGLVTNFEPAAYLNQRVGRISAKNGIDGLGFVFCIVRNQAFKTHAESKSHGSAQANVSGTDLLSYQVVVPPPEILNAFNQLLRPMIFKMLENHELAQTLVCLRDSLLPRLVSGQLSLSDN